MSVDDGFFGDIRENPPPENKPLPQPIPNVEPQITVIKTADTLGPEVLPKEDTFVPEVLPEVSVSGPEVLPQEKEPLLHTEKLHNNFSIIAAIIIIALILIGFIILSFFEASDGMAIFVCLGLMTIILCVGIAFYIGGAIKIIGVVIATLLVLVGLFFYFLELQNNTLAITIGSIVVTVALAIAFGFILWMLNKNDSGLFVIIAIIMILIMADFLLAVFVMNDKQIGIFKNYTPKPQDNDMFFLNALDDPITIPAPLTAAQKKIVNAVAVAASPTGLGFNALNTMTGYARVIGVSTSICSTGFQYAGSGECVSSKSPISCGTNQLRGPSTTTDGKQCTNGCYYYGSPYTTSIDPITASSSNCVSHN